MKKLNTKFLVTILIVIFSLFHTIPILFQNKEMFPDFIEKKSVRLGLDLQGGSQLLLQIETEEALKEKLQNLSEDIRIKFQENNIIANDITSDNKVVKLQLQNENDISKVNRILDDFQFIDLNNDNMLIQLNFTDKHINDFNSSLVLQS